MNSLPCTVGYNDSKPQLDYLRMFEESYARFPGFGNEINGVYQETVDGRVKLYTYVVKE